MGAELPRVVTELPGPRSRALSRDLARFEAPGINTLPGGPGVGPEERVSLVWAEARGATVVDVDGNRFTDLSSGFGVAAIGHRNPAVVAAVREQSERLVHGLGDVHAHPPRIELARRLAALVPVPDARIYFAVSGADAVEIALKSAQLATGRPGVLAFEPSYHGLTLGALAVTSRPAFREPFSAHLHRHLHRLPFGVDLGAVEELLRAQAREGSPVGAVVVEPIVGREGVLLPPPGWLAGLAAMTREAGALLVADEIFTGFGRTGSLFAVDAEEVEPDLLCCGKALGGGLPLGAVAGRREVLEAWATDGEALHTATFVAHPLACAAALAALDEIEGRDLPGRAARLGRGLAERLRRWTRHPAIRQVRGRGLLWGVEVESASRARRWTRAAARRGVLMLAGGPEGRVVQIVPPLTLDEVLLDDALDRLEGALGEPGPGNPTP